jgi:hypothetical protein
MNPISELMSELISGLPRLLLIVFLFGIGLTILIIYGFPALWHWIKPIIHHLTQT